MEEFLTFNQEIGVQFPAGSPLRANDYDWDKADEE